jgi:hypothetical protein
LKLQAAARVQFLPLAPSPRLKNGLANDPGWQLTIFKKPFACQGHPIGLGREKEGLHDRSFLKVVMLNHLRPGQIGDLFL